MICVYYYLKAVWIEESVKDFKNHNSFLNGHITLENSISLSYFISAAKYDITSERITYFIVEMF